jgi:hypothetical protein
MVGKIISESNVACWCGMWRAASKKAEEKRQSWHNEENYLA